MLHSPARRRPHCRTCKAPMAGHKRQHGSPICPSGATPEQEGEHQRQQQAVYEPHLPVSPPQSPPRVKSRSPSDPAVMHQLGHHQIHMGDHPPQQHQPSPPAPRPFEIPLNMPFHRRNPNWVEPTPPPLPRSPSPATSLVPTVLVDSDGRTVRGQSEAPDVDRYRHQHHHSHNNHNHPHSNHNHNGERDDDDVSWMTDSDFLVDKLEQYTTPVASIFGARRKDLPRVQDLTARMGHYTRVIPRPVPSSSPPRTRVGGLINAFSLMVVVGKNEEFVDQLVDSQQMGMPGTIEGEGVVSSWPKLVTYTDLLFVAVVSGALVLAVWLMLIW